MATRKKKTPQGKLHEITDKSVEYSDAMLFHGSFFGGTSLEALLKEYKNLGPYHPIRGELIKHLARCHEQLVEMDALIRARATATPDKELRTHYDKVLPKQAKQRKDF